MAKQTKKKDDEVLFDLMEAGHSTQNFVEKNQSWIIGIVAGILVAIGIYFAYKMIYLAPKEAEATEELYRAELMFEQDSFALALEDPGEGYKGFLDIADDYSMTNAGNLANYYAGISYLNLGRYKAAIAYLSDFEPTGTVTPILKFGAMGDAYSEMAEFDKAATFYKKAANSEDNEFLTPYYLQKLGLLYRSLQKNKEAESTFKRLKADYPSSSQAQEADRYIGE